MNNHSKFWKLRGIQVCLATALLVAALVACDGSEPDLAGTVTALESTIVAQQSDLATWEAAAAAAIVTPTLPPPTEIPTRKPTIVLATPPPVSTVQRPPTATASPTVTPPPTATATATPIPDAAVGEQLTNLRSGPAVGFAVLAEVNPGTPLEVLGRSADNEWIKVRTPDGDEGWMFLLPVILNIPLESVDVTE